MYAWVNGDLWAQDGQPGVTEEHGWLFGVGEHQGTCYGRILSDQEQQVVSKALVNWRWSLDQLELPLG